MLKECRYFYLKNFNHHVKQVIEFIKLILELKLLIIIFTLLTVVKLKILCLFSYLTDTSLTNDGKDAKIYYQIT